MKAGNYIAGRGVAPKCTWHVGSLTNSPHPFQMGFLPRRHKGLLPGLSYWNKLCTFQILSSLARGSTLDAIEAKYNCNPSIYKREAQSHSFALLFIPWIYFPQVMNLTVSITPERTDPSWVHRESRAKEMGRDWEAQRLTYHKWVGKKWGWDSSAFAFNYAKLLFQWRSQRFPIGAPG